MTPAPRLTLSHSTRTVKDLDAVLPFYTDVLGFHVTNRGKEGDAELAFISQDPSEHHQIVLISGMETNPQFMFADHLAFRVNGLDEVRAVKARLEEAGVEGIADVVTMLLAAKRPAIVAGDAVSWTSACLNT